MFTLWVLESYGILDRAVHDGIFRFVTKQAIARETDREEFVLGVDCFRTCVVSTPKQGDGSNDCGVFTCWYAERLWDNLHNLHAEDSLTRLVSLLSMFWKTCIIMCLALCPRYLENKDHSFAVLYDLYHMSTMHSETH